MIVETAMPQIVSWFYVYVFPEYPRSLPILRHECVVSNSLAELANDLLSVNIVEERLENFQRDRICLYIFGPLLRDH
jgi:hypothetical protein